ncbi:hypothetical protein B566_EDAN001995 [Ephemera danica]|nr:hypothetical protein B566_EDAN001995 [Ephemera danica]
MKTTYAFSVVCLGFLFHTVHTSQTSSPTPTIQKSRIAIYCLDDEGDIYCHSKGKKFTDILVKRFNEWNENKNTSSTCRDLVKFHGDYCSIKTTAYNATTVSSTITVSTTEESTTIFPIPTNISNVNKEKYITYETVAISLSAALILLLLSLATLLKYMHSLRQKLAKSEENFAITQQFLKAALEKKRNENDVLDDLLEEQNQDENTSVENLSSKRDNAVQTEFHDATTDVSKFELEEDKVGDVIHTAV